MRGGSGSLSFERVSKVSKLVSKVNIDVLDVSVGLGD